MTTPFDDEPHRRRGLFASLRASFFTGIVVIAPVGLTVWLLWSVMGWIDSVVLPLVPHTFRPEQYIGINLRGVGLIIFLLFTIIVGWIAKGLIGRSLINFAESLVDRMPVVRTVYSGIKQISETVFAQSERSFEKACLVQYPRKGIWAIGFISTSAKGEIAKRAETSGGLVSVFLPTTPNPTSGFLLFVPEEDVIELDMSVEDSAKLVISAGLVYPNPKDPSKPLENGKKSKALEKEGA
ncbi:transmembrane protein [Rhodobacterales bacterium Y4I]|nr:transmembrane protein [Rhodobacterales bacterium Y4I]